VAAAARRKKREQHGHGSNHRFSIATIWLHQKSTSKRRQRWRQQL